MRTIQPEPYGSAFTVAGLAASASFTATTSPATGALTGPTHFPDSTVAADLFCSTLRPTFFGVHDTICPASAAA
ncbi:MAG: hypothetical protein A2W68_18815 [Betaproteobacteria bacterium RIFCSPLOWO2_02_64_14]|nr:MAG: hypothetical protein A2W68_18815 [Betaproteobacteria bacterium RIFCSPLOWO2_02_64_14]